MMRIEKTVDRTSKEKLYVQVYSIFLGKIANGEWPAGSQIPSEEELCRMYDVSKITVREALQELVREGCLRRQQGKGTFVTGSFPHPGIVMRGRLSENDMFGEGVKVEKEVLEKAIRETGEQIGQTVPAEGGIYYVKSKKTVDGDRYSEELFIPLSILPDLDIDEIVKRSLYDLIEEKGTKKIFRVEQTLEVTALPRDIASVVGLKEGSTVLLISRIFLGSDGIPIAFSRVIGRGEKMKFRMEFERIV